MRLIFLTRGPDDLRKPIVDALEARLNPDVNNVKAHVVRYSDFKNVEEPKAAAASLKKAFKMALRTSNRHVVVDTEAPGKQSWMAFASALEDYPGAFVVCIDPEQEEMIFRTNNGYIVHQNVTASNVDEILYKSGFRS